MMDDVDHDQDSLQWSSEDGRSISTTATDLEENYFSAPVVSFRNNQEIFIILITKI